LILNHSIREARTNNSKTVSDAREAQEAARALGLKLQIVHARNETEIERAFATLAQRRAAFFAAS
jgi:hypothetical protein